MQRLLDILTDFRLRMSQEPLTVVLGLSFLFVLLALPPYGGVSVESVKYAFFLFGFAGGLCLLHRTHTLNLYKPFTFVIVLWVLWLTVSTIFSVDPLFSILGSYPRYNSSWLVFVGFGVYALHSVHVAKQRPRFLVLMLWCVALAVSLFAILQSHGIGLYMGLEGVRGGILSRIPSFLGNPNFSGEGPLYHALVLKGYTETTFVTNDPGTRLGADYQYDFDTIMTAMHDWNGGGVENGAKVVVVIYPNL